MDPTQQAASQIIKGGTVTALTVSIIIFIFLWQNKMVVVVAAVIIKLARCS